MPENVALPHVTEEMLHDISLRIVDGFHPDKIILFGSHAYGVAGPQSDIDILVIMESQERPVERALPILQACRPRFVAMDLLVRTPQEVAERLKGGDSFFREVMTRGRVLYERG